MKNLYLILLFIYLTNSFCSFSQKKINNNYNLMPWPKEIKINSHKVIIDKDFTVSIEKNSDRINKSAVKLIRRVTNKTGVFVESGFPLIDNKNATVKIKFKKVAKLKLGVDESYNLNIRDKDIIISANTDIGALRGMQTLFQLIDYDKNNYFFKGAKIVDSPRFKWRGLMVDVARHYQPLNVIKRNLNAMAFVKMNVFHWHLSDDQGFRIYSDKYPNLHKFASDGKYYTHNEIKEIVKYANDLGIRVIPEIDVPGHATAILTAYPELGSKKNYNYKIERFSGIFDPTLNPINPKVYSFLDGLLAEITPLFPDEYFHIGGDENAGKHWDSNSKIQAFKKKHNIDSNHKLQTYFNIKLEKILKKYNKKMIGWDEIMTSTMPKSAIIHSWRGKTEGFKDGTMIKAVKNGYKSILSNDYYIDRMQSVEHYYLCDPIKNNMLTKKEKERVLGGEVTMWGELITPLTIDSRIWPRTAAIAERFWSPKKINDVENMKHRLDEVSLQLEYLGITHLKNRDVILRNLSNGQSIESLKILVDIYEPLKIYSRNKGGAEYKSFSPFTLFADACTTDAKDAFLFNKSVESFLLKNSKSDKENIVRLLTKWKSGYIMFSVLKLNPLLNKFVPFYKGLNFVSQSLLNELNKTKNYKNDADLLGKSMKTIERPLEDTELMIYKSLKKLINHFSLYDK